MTLRPNAFGPVQALYLRWGTRGRSRKHSPLPWGEGGPRPAFSLAGAGRVRGYLLAGQERTAYLKNGGPRYLHCVSCASTLEAPGDGSEGDGER